MQGFVEFNLAALLARRIVVLDGGRVATDDYPSETITEAMLNNVFGVAGAVCCVPAAGTPFVLPHSAKKAGH